jgi:hypothetical protein
MPETPTPAFPLRPQPAQQLPVGAALESLRKWPLTRRPCASSELSSHSAEFRGSDADSLHVSDPDRVASVTVTPAGVNPSAPP